MPIILEFILHFNTLGDREQETENRSQESGSREQDRSVKFKNQSSVVLCGKIF